MITTVTCFWFAFSKYLWIFSFSLSPIHLSGWLPSIYIFQSSYFYQYIHVLIDCRFPLLSICHDLFPTHEAGFEPAWYIISISLARCDIWPNSVIHACQRQDSNLRCLPLRDQVSQGEERFFELRPFKLRPSWLRPSKHHPFEGLTTKVWRHRPLGVTLAKEITEKTCYH